MLNQKEKKITKTQLTITLIIILFMTITGTTFAYYYIANTNSNTITGNMATVNLTLEVNKVLPKENTESTEVMVPQLSTNSALESALKGGCVDQNKNISCQVYKVEIENKGGTATEVVDGKVSFYSDQNQQNPINIIMPNLKWKLVNSVDELTPTNSILGTNEKVKATGEGSNFVSNLTMVTNSKFTYYLIVWIEEIGNDQYQADGNKQFFGKIAFDSSNGTGVTAAFSSFSS